MSEIFRIPSDRQPLDRDGEVFISRPWFLFLQAVFVRIGGSTGTPTEDIDLSISSESNGIDEIAVLMSQIQSLDVAPQVQQMEERNQFLEGELSATRDRLTELERVVQGLLSGNTL
jgi:hypothetical protein